MPASGFDTRMTVDQIRTALAQYTPQEIDGSSFARASVALVLREMGRVGAEFLVIHRAHRSGDPWSGHMALPGGRQHLEDADLAQTAERETREEVGLDLGLYGQPMGQLDDLQAVGRGRLMDMVIRPFVYELKTPVDLVVDRSEVQSAFWISLSSLRRGDVHGTYRYHLLGGTHEFPAFVYANYTIWGLTHRILTGFLDLLDTHAR